MSVEPPRGKPVLWNRVAQHTGNSVLANRYGERYAMDKVRQRMQREVESMAPDRSGLDMSNRFDRLRAGPDFLQRNRAFHNYKPRTVLGMKPSTSLGLINMATRALGLGPVAPEYNSLMPSIYPEGNRHHPVSDVDLLGAGRYLGVLGGPTERDRMLAGAAARFM